MDFRELFEQQRYGQAEELARHRIAGNAEDALAWKALGVALKLQGKPELDALAQAVRLLPQDAGSHYNYGLALHDLGRLDDAIVHYRLAVLYEPSFANGWNNLGNALRASGNRPEAIEALLKAISVSPQNTQAHCNLGLLYEEGENLEAAEQCYRAALQWESTYAKAHNNLGRVLYRGGASAEGMRHFRQALASDPAYAEAAFNLALACDETGDANAAMAHYKYAIAKDPGYLSAYLNLGQLYHRLDLLQEALGCFQEAAKIAPQSAEAYWNAAQTLLSMGNFELGWRCYEYRHHPRLKKRVAALPQTTIPLWRGEPVAGKSFLLCYEQGLGDTIQFARYASVLKDRGAAHVSLQCRAPLFGLMQSAQGVDNVIVSEKVAGQYDYCALLLSLPNLCGTTLSTVPGAVPYLWADEARVVEWRARLPEGRKIGLAWRGNPAHTNDVNRSIFNFDILAPWWRVAKASFVSLQKGIGEEQVRQAAPDQPILSCGDHIHDMSDTAAVIDQLDLVVTVDTAVAHLAGAMGKPCWVLLPAVGTDWRWMRARADSPWYPTMRLFRQKKRGDWADVVLEVAQALAHEFS